jgi:quinolinate synthase
MSEPTDTPHRLPVAGQAPPLGLNADELEAGIRRLKAERNAVILAHYYQEDELQDLADFVGDSLQLSQAAASTQADVIAFCGVHFMAETAKILNPDKVVVVPGPGGRLLAGRRLPGAGVRALAREVPGPHGGQLHQLLGRGEGAVRRHLHVVERGQDRQGPGRRADRVRPRPHLGAFVQKQTGRDDLVLWQGTCIVHETFSERRLLELMARHPDAEVIAHPECHEGILRHAHHVASTSGLITYAKQSPKRTFIVATEAGILHKMAAEAPDKQLIAAPPEDESCACNVCPHMRRNTLEKLYLALRDLQPQVDVPEATRVRAYKPIQRMLELSV